MGAVAIDVDKKSRTYESKYLLYEAKGIKKVIKDFYNIKTRVEDTGDFDGLILLCDVETAIKEANLGNRQAQVVELVKYGYKQAEIAQRMNIEQRTVGATFTQAARKIAKVYHRWEYLNDLLGGKR